MKGTTDLFVEGRQEYTNVARKNGGRDGLYEKGDVRLPN